MRKRDTVRNIVVHEMTDLLEPSLGERSEACT